MAFSKKYRNGLIVGKFSPLHKGHEYLIQTARSRCEKLYVFSYSRPEFAGCGKAPRAKWFADLFPDVEVHVLSYDETLRELGIMMPENDAHEQTHRRFVGHLWQRLIGKPLDVVFTSEHYGDGFAQELTRLFETSRCNPSTPVQHELIDLERANVPISGTAIRENVHKNRDHLSPRVYSSFVKRVCFLGAESTGKTTLSQAVAQQFGTVFVPEFGRTLWEERAGSLAYEDLLTIAETHIASEDRVVLEADRYLFVDTSPLTTYLYCLNMFGKADPKLEKLAGREYDFTFLCEPDFPFVQDGTRSDVAFQAKQHLQHLNQLENRGIAFTALRGSIEDRIRLVSEILGPRG